MFSVNVNNHLLNVKQTDSLKFDSATHLNI